MDMHEMVLVLNGAALAQVDALADCFGDECGKLFRAAQTACTVASALVDGITAPIRAL